VRKEVVVIGAGLAGLSTAAHLARDGIPVLVLEHHAVPGGYAHEFKRRGFRFEVALHALDGAGPGGWLYGMLRRLGVTERVELRRLDPLYAARYPEHDVVAHAQRNDYRAELARMFSSGEVDELITAVGRVGHDLSRYLRDREAGKRPGAAEMLERYPDMAGAYMQSWGDFMASHASDEQLRAVFSTLWGYFGLPPSRLSAGLFAAAWNSYHGNGGYYPIGGSMALSRALESFIVEHGGEVLYRQTVSGIEIERDRVVAVETERGLRIEPDLVVSTAAPTATIAMAGAEHFGDEFVAQMTSDVPALSNLVVYLGLDGDLAAGGWDHHEFFLENGYDVEASYRAAAKGHFAETGMVITDYTHSDPGCAPEGKSVLVLMTLAPWEHAGIWGTDGELEEYSDNPDYRRIKEEAADILIGRAESLIPGLSDRIVIREVATPLTNVRYGRQPHGSIYGREQTVENMFGNRRSPRTPIPNLLLAGAWISGGGMSTALGSGRTAAAIAAGTLRP
jgi:prolycopene isomerase